MDFFGWSFVEDLVMFFAMNFLLFSGVPRSLVKVAQRMLRRFFKTDNFREQYPELAAQHPWIARYRYSVTMGAYAVLPDSTVRRALLSLVRDDLTVLIIRVLESESPTTSPLVHLGGGLSWLYAVLCGSVSVVQRQFRRMVVPDEVCKI